MKIFLILTLYVILSARFVFAVHSFLDTYLQVEPLEDVCGTKKCNISYTISVLSAYNYPFDLQNLMLQEGTMMRSRKFRFEDNTVIRLTGEMGHDGEKVFLGILLFDMPNDVQDYVLVDVTKVIQKGEWVAARFITETVRFRILVYKRNEEEALLTGDIENGERSGRLHNHKDALRSLTGSDNQASNTEIDRKALNFGRPRVKNSRTHNSCVCKKNSCACCEHVHVHKIHLDDIACVNVSYIPEDIGLRLSLSIDTHVFYSRELSLRNPPPVCFEVPHLRKYASLCVEVKDDAITGCSEVQAVLYHIFVARQKLGCFRIPI